LSYAQSALHRPCGQLVSRNGSIITRQAGRDGTASELAGVDRGRTASNIRRDRSGRGVGHDTRRAGVGDALAGDAADLVPVDGIDRQCGAAGDDRIRRNRCCAIEHVQPVIIKDQRELQTSLSGERRDVPRDDQIIHIPGALEGDLAEGLRVVNRVKYRPVMDVISIDFAVVVRQLRPVQPQPSLHRAIVVMVLHLNGQAVPLLRIDLAQIREDAVRNQIRAIIIRMTQHQIRVDVDKERQLDVVIRHFRIVLAGRELHQRVDIHGLRFRHRNRSRRGPRNAQRPRAVIFRKRDVARQRLALGLQLERLRLVIVVRDRTAVRVGAFERLDCGGVARPGFPRQVGVLERRTPDVGLVHARRGTDRRVGVTDPFSLEVIGHENRLCRCRERESARAHRQKL